jgi:hypothetical protein
VDHQFDLNRVVGVGNAVVLHDGRLYSHPARDRDRNRVVAVDQRPPPSMSGCESKRDSALPQDAERMRGSAQPQ